MNYDGENMIVTRRPTCEGLEKEAIWVRAILEMDWSRQGFGIKNKLQNFKQMTTEHAWNLPIEPRLFFERQPEEGLSTLPFSYPRRHLNMVTTSLNLALKVHSQGTRRWYLPDTAIHSYLGYTL